LQFHKTVEIYGPIRHNRVLFEFIDDIRFPFLKIRKDEAGIDHFEVFWGDVSGPRFFNTKPKKFQKKLRPAEKRAKAFVMLLGHKAL
jgi:hypothetical protein